MNSILMKFADSMPRRYSPIGHRCSGEMDWGARGRTNVIGAIWPTTYDNSSYR